MRTKDYADVVIKPPILFLAALVIGCLLTYLFPIGPGLAAPNGAGLAVGLAFIAVGMVLGIFPTWRLRKAGTSVMPGETSTVLVQEGAYKVTRNPIYIGLLLIYFGLCLVLTSIWMLLLIVPAMMILHHGVVLREEDYLTWKFGDAYRHYRDRVPRWL
ncbi:MAG: isoprenylcysteine carboxylmethyltransferase family protein [Pseudomonadota bacterium]